MASKITMLVFFVSIFAIAVTAWAIVEISLLKAAIFFLSMLLGGMIYFTAIADE